ncbi:unnamed protein product [Lupinus luteus]|uniref:Pentatricopeptide repeat-containing protein n=1 Tax=Lupinus luteus TaxID=3873 RepID=A0AAV1W253_LUPLU
MCVDTSECFDSNEDESYNQRKLSPRIQLKIDVKRILDVLRQDVPEFDFRLVLDKLHTRPSAALIFAECGELKAMWRLVDEMIEKGDPASARTFDILICTCGEAGFARRLVGNKLLAAHNILIHMRETDVVAYTVMIRGYVVTGEVEKAEEKFNEMISRGQIPNVFTYNSMSGGLCLGGKFDEAFSMLNEMETEAIKSAVMFSVKIEKCVPLLSGFRFAGSFVG